MAYRTDPLALGDVKVGKRVGHVGKRRNVAHLAALARDRPVGLDRDYRSRQKGRRGGARQ